MNGLPFYIVDVFAENKYEGNQLAVVRGAGKLAKTEMQRIAKEMNYSETTFILSDETRNGGYDVRIFTPETELPFAGHPTLGTAYIIQQEILEQPAEQVVLNLGVGPIPVTFEINASLSPVESTSLTNMLWMKQNTPVFGETFDPADLAQVLSIDTSDINEAFPIQSVSTGIAAIIVPLRTLSAVRRCKINKDKNEQLFSRTEAKPILVFAPETYHQDNDLNVRVFVDSLGVPEDPATGSANGNLASYLVKHRYFRTSQIDLRVEQGYEIRRPSLLFLRAGEPEGNGSGIDVRVGGHVVMVAKGELM
jgi:trans-2,3-dihydro-3-hydroxyanthranilate isomerase